MRTASSFPFPFFFFFASLSLVACGGEPASSDDVRVAPDTNELGERAYGPCPASHEIVGLTVDVSTTPAGSVPVPIPYPTACVTATPSKDPYRPQRKKL